MRNFKLISFAFFLLAAATFTPTSIGAPQSDPPFVVPQVPVQNPLGLPGDRTGLAASCACNSPGSVETTASVNHGQCDTILLHSGQEVRDELDLYIPGIEPALDIMVQRRHTSRRVASNENIGSLAIPWDESAFGLSWSFNYQRRLVKAANTEYLREIGFDRADDFYPVSGTNRWEGTAGRIDRVIWDGNNATPPILVRADGLRLIYSPFSQFSARLEGLVTPNGNSIAFHYAQNPHSFGNAATYRMTEIVDSYGRLITLHHGITGSPNRISSIEDFDGRIFAYSYDGSGNYLTHRSDAAGNDWIYEYGYSASSIPELTHNLTAIIFPNQADQTGATADLARLQWNYFTSTEVGQGGVPSWALGWVKSHTVGNQSQNLPFDVRAGGTFQYTYSIPGTPSWPPGPNEPTLAVHVVDRRGHASDLQFNRLGQMLNETILADLRHPNAPQVKTRTFRYTEDGLLVKATGAMGDTVDLVYEATTRAADSNQREQKYTPDTGRGAQQADVTARIVYEPIFNKPWKVTDPRGLQPGQTAAAYTTTYVYDYMEDLTASLAALDGQALLPLSLTDTQQLLVDLGIGAYGDVNADGSTAQFAGNLVQVVHPLVGLPGEAASVPLPTTQSATELFRFNSKGQLIWHRDAEENVHLRTYYPVINIPSDPNQNVSGVGLGTTYNPIWEGGYLRSVIVDAADSIFTAARNSGFATAPVSAETLFLYSDNQGPAGPGYSRSVPTLVVDPRGVVTRFDLDQLDDIVKVTRAAGSADPNLQALQYETIIERDANRNVTSIQVEEADNLDGLTGYTTFEWEYNILDLETKSREDSVGGSALDATVHFYYDENTNLTILTRLHDNPTDSSTTVWAYDERDIVMSRTDGSGTLNAATFSNDIDANGNVISMTDADPGADSQPDTAYVEYDGFDRVVKFTERDGTETILTRDAVGNVIRQEIFGKIERLTSTAGAVAVDPVQLLSEKLFAFDTRNRLFQVDEKLFFYNSATSGPHDNGEILDSGALNTQGGATGAEDDYVSSVLVRDRLGRVVVAVDADADEFIYRYDGRGNLTELEDDLANKSIYGYDLNGNLTQVTEEERSPIMAGVTEAFVQQATYDALNRLTSWIEPNQQTTSCQYDSRDNLKRRIDALGNQVDYRYDRLDRLVQVSQYLAAGGTGASSTNFDASQGGDPSCATPATGAPDGVITTKSGWDDLGRLISQTDDRGNVTSYTYDVLDRRTQVGYGDGTFERAFYNGDGELLVAVDPSGVLDKAAVYDEVGRRLQETVGLAYQGAGLDIVGTTMRRWRYDGLGRVWGYTDNNDSTGQAYNDTLVEFRYDSLGRPIWERQTIGASTLPPMKVNYQGRNRVKSEVYPGGRRIQREYNGLDRLTRVEDATTIPAALISEREYVGRGRLLRQAYGNGTVLDKRNTAGNGSISGPGAGFDSNGRTIHHEWKYGAQTVAGYVSTYNDVNRRTTETRTHFTGHSDSYTFDSAYRMIAFTRGGTPSVSSGASLDGVDKMFAFNDEGVPRVPVIDQHVQGQENGLNQYSSFDNQSRRYDKNGGLNDWSGGANGRQECRYDHLKRLTRVGTVSGSTFTQSHEYVYDAEGRRLAKLDSTAGNAIITRYVYDCGWRVIEERDNAGAVQREFVEGEGIDEHLVMIRTTGPLAGAYYYHANEQGFIGALTNSAGAAVERYEYKWLGDVYAVDAAGTAIPAGGPTDPIDGYGRIRELGNPYQFQGRELDLETGYYQFRHRYYDPEVGEFTSVDPSGLWSHGQGSGYSAFAGDAINLADPLGLRPQEPALARNGLRIVRGPGLLLRGGGRAAGALLGPWVAGALLAWTIYEVATGGDDSPAASPEADGGRAPASSPRRPRPDPYPLAPGSYHTPGPRGGVTIHVDSVGSQVWHFHAWYTGSQSEGGSAPRPGGGSPGGARGRTEPSGSGDATPRPAAGGSGGDGGGDDEDPDGEGAYPGKVGKMEDHHIIPRYVGGPAKGPTVRLPAPLHQLVTNAWRAAFKYGCGPQPLEKVLQVAEKISRRFRLDRF